MSKASLRRRLDRLEELVAQRQSAGDEEEPSGSEFDDHPEVAPILAEINVMLQRELERVRLSDDRLEQILQYREAVLSNPEITDLVYKADRKKAEVRQRVEPGARSEEEARIDADAISRRTQLPCGLVELPPAELPPAPELPDMNNT